MGEDMAKGMEKVPETGIYILDGIPGAGKSYAAVQQIIDEVTLNRRVVYTNLPLKLKTVRAYLYLVGRYQLKMSRADARVLSKYVRPLRQDHFRAFCLRLADIDRRADEIMGASGSNTFAADGTFDERVARDQARAVVAEEQGPEVLTGSGANWLPPMAVLVIDELHKWFPNATQSKEPREILGYTTMHRHMMHKLFVLSQRAMNVSISFRTNCQEFWRVENLRRHRAVYFIRWPFLLIKVSRFASHECRNGEPQQGVLAHSTDVYWPRWTGGVIFRLYDSHSHVMDVDQAGRVVKSLMAEVAESKLEGSAKMQMPKATMDRVLDWMLYKFWRLFSWPLRHWKFLGLLLVVWWMAGGPGGSGAEVAESEAGSAESAAVASTQPADRGKVYVELQGVCAEGALVNGKLVAVGSVFEGMELVRVDAASGYSLWRVGDRGFVWSVQRGVQSIGDAVGGSSGVGAWFARSGGTVGGVVTEIGGPGEGPSTGVRD